jgi:putative tryptophan/tyrosine transport system substrate-binding protein
VTTRSGNASRPARRGYEQAASVRGHGRFSGFRLPFTSWAQPRPKPPRVALVFNAPPVADVMGAEPAYRYARAFVHRLRELGYVEGRDIVLERHSSEGQIDRLPALMQDLVERRVDLIVTAGPGAQEAIRATRTIPIVAVVDDPVGSGVTESMARPTLNATGVTDSAGLEMHSKRLQLLKVVAPKSTRVAVLDFKYVDRRTAPGTHLRRVQIEATARTLGISLIPVGVDDVNDLDPALSAAVRQSADSLIEMGHPVTLAGRRTIVEFAARNRLPAVYSDRAFVDIGGLLSYGADCLRSGLGQPSTLTSC